MPYDLALDGEVHDLADVKYLLSPKDLAGVRAVPELVALGVHGLKIEGRQKGPQYVPTAVSLYRRWLDAVVQGGADTPGARRRLQDDLLATSLAYNFSVKAVCKDKTRRVFRLVSLQVFLIVLFPNPVPVFICWVAVFFTVAFLAARDSRVHWAVHPDSQTKVFQEFGRE